MRKAEISIGVLVSIIVILIVLIVVFIIFHKQMGQLFGAFKTIITGTTDVVNETKIPIRF